MSEAAAAPTPAGGNNKMLFIMMGAMFFLLVAGMGGMYVMLSKKEAGKDESATEAAAEHGEKNKAGEAKEGGAKAAASYVSFEPPFVVNFPAGSSSKFLQVTVQAMTRDEVMKKDMEGNTPAIRDALLTLFGQQAAEVLATPEGKEELRVKSLEAVRNVMKNEGKLPEQVEAIYFTSFVMQ